jgi:hypothetical protein
MSNETPETIQTREAVIFRTVIGIVLVVALAFGVLTLTGVIRA